MTAIQIQHAKSVINRGLIAFSKEIQRGEKHLADLRGEQAAYQQVLSDLEAQQPELPLTEGREDSHGGSRS